MTLDFDALTIYEVEACHKVLLGVLNADEHVTLDFTKIQKIDMAGIQLLISFIQTLQNNTYQCEFINISDDVTHSIITSGCDTILGVS